MPITSVSKDAESLTMTVVADFAAPMQRLWDAYADPRQLEKFWGPPSFPILEARDKTLETGMVEGMEPTYARLESLLVSV